MFTLKIPQTLKTDKSGYDFLASVEPTIRENATEGQGLLVDFSQCSTINGNLAAAIGALLDRVSPFVGGIIITSPKNNKVKRVLARNHFLKAWSVESNVEEKENYVEYSRFKCDASSKEFKAYIQEGLIHKQKFPQHTDLAGERIAESIFEIYVNAVTHGATDYVYSCGEYFQEEHRLEMSIVDCGQTIPGNVNEYLQEKYNYSVRDCPAIEWAFVSGNTTKSQTGGLGLALIKDFIELNEGSIQVVSGLGFIEYHGNSVERFLLNNPFPGTVVNMKFNFDDNKKYFMESEKHQVDNKDLL